MTMAAVFVLFQQQLRTRPRAPRVPVTQVYDVRARGSRSAPQRRRRLGHTVHGNRTQATLIPATPPWPVDPSFHSLISYYTFSNLLWSSPTRFPLCLSYPESISGTKTAGRGGQETPVHTDTDS